MATEVEVVGVVLPWVVKEVGVAMQTRTQKKRIDSAGQLSLCPQSCSILSLLWPNRKFSRNLISSS